MSKQQTRWRGIDDLAIFAEYAKCNSVHKTGKMFGVCGETVRRRLVASGFKLSGACWTESEDADLEEMWGDADKTIADIAAELNRTTNAISCRAGRLGIRGTRIHKTATSKTRAKMSNAQKKNANKEKRAAMSERAKRWHQENAHPKGFSGQRHTEEAKAIISEKGKGRKHSPESINKRLKTKLARYGRLGNDISRQNATWKAGWREVGGKRKYFRSRWEANYARYLEWLRSLGQLQDWEHEPKTFWFEGIRRGTRSYLPDFRVTENDGSIHYIEVKGWMDSRSKTKLKRMARYHPDVDLRLVDSGAYRTLCEQVRGIINGWE